MQTSNEPSYEQVIAPLWKKAVICVSLLVYVAFYFVVDISNLGLLGILILSFLLALFVVLFARHKTPSAKRRYQECWEFYQKDVKRRDRRR